MHIHDQIDYTNCILLRFFLLFVILVHLRQQSKNFKMKKK